MIIVQISVRLCNVKMVGPKKQDFWPKINILKGNHCVFRIRGAPVRQKLDMILGNEVLQKLKLERNCTFKVNILALFDELMLPVFS